MLTLSNAFKNKVLLECAKDQEILHSLNAISQTGLAPRSIQHQVGDVIRWHHYV